MELFYYYIILLLFLYSPRGEIPSRQPHQGAPSMIFEVDVGKCVP